MVGVLDLKTAVLTAGLRRTRLLLFVIWCLSTLLLSSDHAVWRDEVRAYSIAVDGDNFVQMFSGLRGEGHPAVWYVLIRIASVIAPGPVALKAASLLVAGIAMALFVFRSPFGLPFVSLVLLSRFSLFEYSVMARNYGVSMLLMFLFASLYSRFRARTLTLGILLFLLANTNAHSIILVCAFLCFWLFDSVRTSDSPKTVVLRTFFLNAAIAGCGVAVSMFTVYPTVNDAVGFYNHEGRLALVLLEAIFSPAGVFQDLVVVGRAMEKLFSYPFMAIAVSGVLMSAVLFGSLLVLVRWPAALVSASIALLGFSLFFSFVSSGGYRHQALWLVFLISLYWICHASTEKLTGSAASHRTQQFFQLGRVLLTLLLLLQVVSGLVKVLPSVFRDVPASRSRDVGELLSRSKELKDAIVIADPDFMVEALSYYVLNPTYLLREQRFGNVVIFTRNARLHLSLDDVLDDALRLRATTGKAVVILLQHRLDRNAPAKQISEGYNWHLSITPEQVRNFLDNTRLIKSFGPVSNNDETYDAYVLKQ